MSEQVYLIRNTYVHQDGDNRTVHDETVEWDEHGFFTDLPTAQAKVDSLNVKHLDPALHKLSVALTEEYNREREKRHRLQREHEALVAAGLRKEDGHTLPVPQRPDTSREALMRRMVDRHGYDIFDVVTVDQVKEE